MGPVLTVKKAAYQKKLDYYPIVPIAAELRARSGWRRLLAPTRESLISHKGSSLDIPGYLDVDLRDYSEWQQSRFQEPSLQAEVRKACDALLMEAQEGVREDTVLVSMGSPTGRIW